jgi:hypothetical protein
MGSIRVFISSLQVSDTNVCNVIYTFLSLDKKIDYYYEVAKNNSMAL